MVIIKRKELSFSERLFLPEIARALSHSLRIFERQAHRAPGFEPVEVRMALELLGGVIEELDRHRQPSTISAVGAASAEIQRS